MTALRVYSFLGEAAAPHFSAVSELVARAAGCEPAPLAEPGLAQLDEIVATPGAALVFLCGLPYVRLRDDNAPIEAIAAAVPRGEPAPRYFADLVVRAGLEAGSAADLVGRRIGFNGRDSLSGFVLPYRSLMARGLAAPVRRCHPDRQPPQLAGAARRRARSMPRASTRRCWRSRPGRTPRSPGCACSSASGRRRSPRSCC